VRHLPAVKLIRVGGDAGEGARKFGLAECLALFLEVAIALKYPL
jgi:hypothetical protein